ncbi:hypothetical protein ACWIG5_41700 [Streptomyces lydicus]
MGPALGVVTRSGTAVFVTTWTGAARAVAVRPVVDGPVADGPVVVGRMISGLGLVPGVMMHSGTMVVVTM